MPFIDQADIDPPGGDQTGDGQNRIDQTDVNTTRVKHNRGGTHEVSTPSFTIGVIARNGMPFLQHCLKAIASLSDEAVHVILVDSGSSDNTLATMLAFRAERSDTRVFHIEGQSNASVARNVVLSHAPVADLLLLDGDVALSAEFITAARDEMRAGNADAVYGQLPEIWHNAQGEAYDTHPDRYHVQDRREVDMFMGIVMLSAKVVSSKLKYDESQRRFEDIEYSVRVSDQFKLLALPVAMGTHYTDSYHSVFRLGDFIKAQYQRPIGAFIRKYWRRPGIIKRVMHHFSGYMWGLFLQCIALLGVLLLSPMLFGVGVMLLTLDAARLWKQGRLHEFLPLRIIGGWQIVMGFFLPGRDAVSYSVTEKF